MIHRWVSNVVFAGLVLASATMCSGAEAQDLFGIQDTDQHFISAEEFIDNVQTDYSRTFDGFWTAGTPGALPFVLVAPMRLPAGALVTGYSVIYYDNDAGGEMLFKLVRYWVTATGTTGSEQIGTPYVSSGTPGVAVGFVDLDPDVTIWYSDPDTLTYQSYVFELSIARNVDQAFRGVVVHWKRQISPAPAVATFADVPVGAFGFQHVEALAASGITAGCDATNFCPDQPLTRVQMAVFLAKALGLHWAE